MKSFDKSKELEKAADALPDSGRQVYLVTPDGKVVRVSRPVSPPR